MPAPRILAASLVLLAAACGSAASTPTESPTAHQTRSRSQPPPTGVTSTPATPSLEPTGVPSGTPDRYLKDVPATKIPPGALVPTGVAVTDAWSTTTRVGQTAGVAYVQPGDPLQAPRGLVIWWRSPGSSPPWHPMFGLTTGAGVLQMETLLGEATGDGSDDALIFEGTGGSGACGTTVLVDLAANARVFKRTACDAVIGFSPDPVGLTVRTAVFAPSDSHCCPSAFRTTVLTYTGERWVVASRTTTPA